MLSEKIKIEQFKNTIRISITSGVISALVCAISNMRSITGFFTGAIVGLVIGFGIPFCYIQVENYFHLNMKVHRLPYLVYIGLNFFTLTIVAISFYSFTGIIMFGEYVVENFKYAVYMTLSIAMVLTIQDTLNQFLGKRFLSNMLIGKYHIPKEEKMIVCFVDLRDSTKWAEDLGGQKFFNMINDFLLTVEQCASYYSGEIYKFLGDGIIIVWHSKESEYKNALSFMIELRDEMIARQEYFYDLYGNCLKYTLGMHEGRLIIGELGLSHKEIGYWGDTINTTSRIASECKNQEDYMMISEELYKEFSINCKELIGSFRAEVVKDVILRGKTQAMNLVRIK